MEFNIAFQEQISEAQYWHFNFISHNSDSKWKNEFYIAIIIFTVYTGITGSLSITTGVHIYRKLKCIRVYNVKI